MLPLLFPQFHRWFDKLKEPNRFLFFFGTIAVPFVFCVNIWWFTHNPVLRYGCAIIVWCILVLVSDRVRLHYGWYKKEVPREDGTKDQGAGS